ncbi:ABC transporter ATP-binding protein [Petroclostridium sp. X23]|uniref:ABC transporter ATP-binding protein n=1 Tax=Petroclostridium sp. X23 TaxID=3045146 RepID=UPI0024AD9093|nr:ABC transporter ATP-binding protein [Petroclostridium sp. X23]WHH56901.1 ABC transporter ATP-binding protein [Petroclostridium sp. X23]
MITIKKLSKAYKNTNIEIAALKDLDLKVDQGSIYAIVGPSGCGKSTLLYILAGIIKPDEGSIMINGQPFNRNEGHISLMLQDYGLLPWKTVWQNVTLGLEIKKNSKTVIKERAKYAIGQLGLEDFSELYPSQLSGGQKQRVAFARAISMRSNILLMDEPFSALDAITREAAQDTFMDLWEKTGMTGILVTHNIEEAVYLGKKIGIMSSAPGRISAEVDNIYQGSTSVRDTSEFYKVCGEIRRQLREYDI